MIGKTLAHYEIVAALGKGGMGEVFRARDTQLDRDVAIKILPDLFSKDADRVARFKREAKLLASLNHPHIAQMYGIHTEETLNFLAMEFVDGENLQQRLERGPIPMDEALPLARQLALALEAAHAQGIVHRDLKPANIVCRPDGTLKVLDFGLAKATSPDGVSGEYDPANSPTITSAGTLPGLVLGTAAYMAPEQARGRGTDARCDLWAFGAVLMEMITGRQVFAGETVSDILAAVIKSEPEWNLLPDDTAPAIRRLLQRCLCKNPTDRIHHAADARLEIDDALAHPHDGANASGASTRPASRIPWIIAAVAVVAAIALGVRGLSTPEPQADRVAYRFEVRWRGENSISISPDGSRFAWVKAEDGNRTIQVRRFDEDEARPVGESDVWSTELAWSPDGRQILYMTESSLMRLPVDGGIAQTMCELPSGGRSVDMNSRGAILVEVGGNPDAAGWYLLRPGSRELEAYERPLAPETGQTRSRPRFLADGEHFVFAQPVGGTRRAILGRLDSPETKILFDTDSSVLPVDGWYVYSVRGTLLARAYDPATWEPVGEPRVLADRVGLFAPTGYLHATAARNGTILYSTDGRRTELVWFDAGGNELESFFEDDKLQHSTVSPTGTDVVVVIEDWQTGTGDLWKHDLVRGIVTRLTETSFAEFNPIISPDGRRIAYSADTDGPPNLYVMDARGGEPTEILPPEQRIQYPSAWSADGQRVVFMRGDTETGVDLWIVDAQPGAEPEELVRTSSSEWGAAVSPDGAWLAYTRFGSGEAQVWLRGMDDSGPGEQVTVGGGAMPKWAGANRILYLGSDDSIMSVDVELGPDGVSIDEPRTVIRLEDHELEGFSLHPDGRILVQRQFGEAMSQTGTALVGWQ